MWGPVLGDIDNGPTKTWLLEHRNDPKVKKCYDLCCAKRPADELYDLSRDPYQLTNVAADPEYANVLRILKDQLTKELRLTGDPRVLGKGDNFDSYPYLGEMKKGSK